jgi:hypothetical protein
MTFSVTALGVQSNVLGSPECKNGGAARQGFQWAIDYSCSECEGRSDNERKIDGLSARSIPFQQSKKRDDRGRQGESSGNQGQTTACQRKRRGVSRCEFNPAPGHSPAQSAILFASGSDQLLHMADVVHRTETGLQHPEWSITFDYDGEQAIKTRKATLERVATDRMLVMGYHFPFPAIGRVERSGSAYRWSAAPWMW